CALSSAQAETQMKKQSALSVLNVMILSDMAGVSTRASGVVLAECITEPSLQSPRAGHWYYHTDPESQRKCWYVGRPGVKVPRTVNRESRPSKPKSDARITKKMDADSEVSHQLSGRLNETAREALFQEFLRWQERQNRSHSSPDEVNRDALFGELLVWQVQHMDGERTP